MLVIDSVLALFFDSHVKTALIIILIVSITKCLNMFGC